LCIVFSFGYWITKISRNLIGVHALVCPCFHMNRAPWMAHKYISLGKFELTKEYRLGWSLHWYRNGFSHVLSTKLRQIAAVLKTIHAGGDMVTKLLGKFRVIGNKDRGGHCGGSGVILDHLSIIEYA
jgi:hypothetical protein